MARGARSSYREGQIDMLERLTFFGLAGLLIGSACIIDAIDDDDSAGDSGGATSSAASGTASASASGSGTASPDGTGDETAAADTASGGACGWGPTGDDMVPQGYVCGGDGVDPDGMFAFDCPAEATLEVGAECGDIEGPGCCDADGDVWYCGNDGSGPALARQEC